MKKLLLSLMISFSLFTLLGCEQKREVVEIKTNELLSFDGNYYVYFYSEQCGGCAETTPRFIGLVEKGKINGYLFNTNKQFINVTEDQSHKNIGVRYVKDILISVTPTLIYVENGVIKQQYNGSREILSHLK